MIVVAHRSALVENTPVAKLERRSCYVAMPLGLKTDSVRGIAIDFDRIYELAVRPAAEDAGFDCRRADNFQSRGAVQREIAGAVLASDAMIADLTTANANVLYELGLRHGGSNGITLLLRDAGSTPTADLDWLEHILYRLDGGTIREEEASSLRTRIAAALGGARRAEGSPVLQATGSGSGTGTGSGAGMRFGSGDGSGTASGSGSGGSSSSTGGSGTGTGSGSGSSSAFRGTSTGDGSPRPPATIRDRLLEIKSLSGRDVRKKALARVETALSSSTEGPEAWVDLLLAYRDNSGWDEVIRLADWMPEVVRSRPLVRQQLALALNRRRDDGDVERALTILNELIARDDRDPESFGLLGRIYKDRYFESRSPEYLEQAIDAYRRGYDADRNDYYPGVNLATLLYLRGDQASRDEARFVANQLRAILESRAAGGVTGFWESATSLELAVLAGDFDACPRLIEDARGRAPANWMLETTARNLRIIAEASGPDRSRIEELAFRLAESAELA